MKKREGKESLGKFIKRIKENMKPDCVYRDKCLSEGIKCFDCDNNKKNKLKKDFYKPKLDYSGRNLTW
jgi:hypothetical protein